MEKKNINIWVVRTCIILLLTVFTIGRKYGQDQNAADLINNLKQQPCACCLNFENVDASALVIDGAKRQLQNDKNQLEKDNEKLVDEKGILEKANGQLINDNQRLETEKTDLVNDKSSLQNNYEDLKVEKNKFSDLLQQRNLENNELIKNIKKLKEVSAEINKAKEKQEKLVKYFKERHKNINIEKKNLEDILKVTKTNANIEEIVKYYNNIFAEKKAKIDLFLHTNGKEIMEKKYTFYIPFKFKDYGNCFKKKDMPGLFKQSVGYYSDDKTLDGILRSLFLRYGIEEINKEKIINVKILKEIYFCVNFKYSENKAIKTDLLDNMNGPVDCYYSPDKIFPFEVPFEKVANGSCYKEYKKKVQLKYSQLIELVKIEEYLLKKKTFEDDKDLFLLELDFKDPECIALLEFVGKGNYGVVKKGLTFENGKLVTKAIKFTCTNEEFNNSTEENILKEIRAGKIVNEIGVGNKIAFVKDYMKIDKFIQRYDYKKEEKTIVPLEEETENGDLTNAVYTTFLNDNLKTLPVGKKDVRKDFQNNVFNMNGNIGNDLYIMFMDIVNGKDLFLKEQKDVINLNDLGKMLFDVLNNLSISGVALKDIKPKNIMWDEQKKEFSIIDVQTLGIMGNDLTDSYGTPELWPFFKTLNLKLDSKNKIVGENKKDNLYDRFCNSIDDNFVDIYAACMTMYFTKFNTYTAAGLLTLLLKWIVLEEDKKTTIKDKIDLLKNYEKNYTTYIKCVNNNEKVLEEKKGNNILDEDIEPNNKKNIKYFFEEIDDRNLNNDQKKNLANLLKQVIILGKESNIFYLLEEIKNIINGYENNNVLNEDINNIINFYEERVKKDFDNFTLLNKENCKYADVIKYVLCYGSCLNYNVENKEEMNVDDILPKLKLKEKIEIKDKEFFNGINNELNKVIGNLQSGFNQKFIIDLLNILPLEEYNEILEHGVSRNSVDYHFENKKKSLKNENLDNYIEKQKKVFYLLRYLEINKLFHIPKNILKINSLIDENTDNKDEEGFLD